MTACVNKKHSRRVAAAISASLVGALTLGAAPAVVMAAEAGVEQQFLDPEGALNIGKITSAKFKHGTDDITAPDSDGVFHTTFSKNTPVILDEVTVDLIGSGSETGQFVINPDEHKDECSVEYFKRGTDGYPADSNAITSDIVAVGKYVAKVTVTKGQYKGGIVYIPFDIDSIKLKSVELAAGQKNSVIYNGEVRDFDWVLKDTAGQPIDATEGVDYKVEYVYTGHDATPENVKDVCDAGKYVAKVTGTENGVIEGSVELSTPIEVTKLDLDTATLVPGGADVWIENVIKAGEGEPDNLFFIWIEGKRFDSESNVVKQLKADLKTDASGVSGDVWFDNTAYTYTLKARNADDPNITGDCDFSANKVANEVSFKYGDADLPESATVVTKDPSTYWDFSKVSAFYADGTIGGKSITTGINHTVIDAKTGRTVADSVLTTTPGDYVIAYWALGAGNVYGGTDFVNVKVVTDVVNADAEAAVLYDVDDDTIKEVVSSINVPYEAGRNLIDDIEVAVELDDDTKLVKDRDFFVTYYNADNVKVNKVENAGTYTLKVTSDTYQLNGTTEMAITIGKMDISNVKSGAVVTKTFDNVGSGVDYLPWREWGYSISGVPGEIWTLDLEYKDADGKWVKMDGTHLLSDVLKVTILKDGQEVKKIEDEGVYTVHFELRNADAQNNYVLPADITVTCIKDGGAKGDKDEQGTNHLRYADVTYADYFADPVDWIAGKGIMTGYKDGRVFGSLDSLSRGQVACVLYNMATKGDKVDESSLHYSEIHGWETGFSDVDGKAYYGKAIAWAAQSGVVNGYADGTFHADQAVTRQEFACMLANYAKKYGTYKAASSDALDEMSDADQVAEFATESVAWAVENGIIGNSGYVAAGSTIIRADAACMVYNYAK